MLEQNKAAEAGGQMPPGSFLVHHNLASFAGYVVENADGSEAYRFHNHIAVGKQRWTMQSTSGANVATLTRPVVHIHPTFTVDRPGHGLVTIRKANFARTNETWRVEGTELGDLDVEGDLLDHEFTIANSSGQTLATVSRRWVTVLHSYGVQTQGIDPVLAISAVVGIDSAEHKGH